ncbi:MAG: hypothetical protein R2849_01570 [Thermomicrobiales bacterium]
MLARLRDREELHLAILDSAWMPTGDWHLDHVPLVLHLLQMRGQSGKAVREFQELQLRRSSAAWNSSTISASGAGIRSLVDVIADSSSK